MRVDSFSFLNQDRSFLWGDRSSWYLANFLQRTERLSDSKLCQRGSKPPYVELAGIRNVDSHFAVGLGAYIIAGKPVREAQNELGFDGF